MPYAAFPDHRIPYDVDGTLVYFASSGNSPAAVSGANQIAINDHDHTTSFSGLANATQFMWFFFPEQREVTGVAASGSHTPLSAMLGSNDTTNGLDGTWETASFPSGLPPNDGSSDGWRDSIRPVSFAGPKQTVRLTRVGGSGGNEIITYHLYGEAAAGAMAHDLIFLDPDLGAGVAYPAPEDFGDQPLGTTVVRPFRIKNTSASRTATNVNIQCNDARFTIATSASGPWVVTINLASLAPGAESATMYVRCTTAAVGSPLGPHGARIIVIADSGFFG